MRFLILDTNSLVGYIQPIPKQVLIINNCSIILESIYKNIIFPQSARVNYCVVILNS